jgi:hypothetical protein
MATQPALMLLGTIPNMLFNIYSNMSAYTHHTLLELPSLNTDSIRMDLQPPELVARLVPFEGESVALAINATSSGQSVTGNIPVPTA